MILPQSQATPATKTFAPLHRLNLTGTEQEAKQNEVLARAVHADTIRRIKAICECELWVMEKDRTLTRRDGTKTYPAKISLGKSTCTCPDAARVESIERRERSASVHASLSCKHTHIRALFCGLSISVYDPETDALIVRASLKSGQSKPTVAISDINAYSALLKVAYELSDTELDRTGKGSVH